VIRGGPNEFAIVDIAIAHRFIHPLGLW